MLIDAFRIDRNNSTVAISITGASAATNLPASGGFLELQNTGPNIAFIETSPAGVTAVTTTSYPVLAGQSKIVRIKDGDAVINVIGSAAGGTLYVTPGVGV
jgi:hypothetical protein